MKEKDIQDDLASIRSLMERSSKFISLSGLSGILAGVYALIGAGFAYKLFYNGAQRDSYINGFPYTMENFMDTNVGTAAIVAVLILAASIVTGILLSYRKAKRSGQPFWSKTSRELLFHMTTPLLSGGILIIILLYRGYFGIVAPSMLIFYGLALIGASNFTFTDVKYLGLCEIALGLIAAALPGYGLIFWALGFGVLHIVYGSVMYLKYDR